MPLIEPLINASIFLLGHVSEVLLMIEKNNSIVKTNVLCNKQRVKIAKSSFLAVQ